MLLVLEHRMAKLDLKCCNDSWQVGHAVAMVACLGTANMTTQ